MQEHNGGRILLVLVGADARTAAQLGAASGLGTAQTLRELVRLVERGFVVVHDPAGAVAVYRLNPKDVRTEEGEPQRRILLIEDDTAIQDMMQLLLEDEGYAVVVSRTPADANALLGAVAFDLVITDGFSKVPSAVVTNTLDVLTAAGATPVALFTAHHLELDEARAAGFRDLIEKPFDLDTLERQVRTLLQAPAP
jgi:two-component system OmpR family response regulator/two-component system phosphate regulon response regulator PhoB